MTELKPCPFCGGDANIDKSDYRFPDGAHAMDGYSARCIVCGARTCEYRTACGAVDAWNSRAERTCRMETDQLPEGGAIWSECSVCGAQFGWDDCMNIAGMNYCPKCGGRIVE